MFNNRKTVCIMGVGPRKSGNSKSTGKPYDFIEVSFGYEVPGFCGTYCETVCIDSAKLDSRKLSPGDVVDILYHSYKYKTYVDAIL